MVAIKFLYQLQCSVRLPSSSNTASSLVNSAVIKTVYMFFCDQCLEYKIKNCIVLLALFMFVITLNCLSLLSS